MNVTILFRHTPTNTDAEELIHQRVSSHFGRFSNRIDTISVTLSDVNGPKGGLDQQCHLVITTPGLAPVVITEQQAEQGLAIGRALSRGKMALARQLKKSKHLRQGKASLKRQYPFHEDEVIENLDHTG